MRLSATDALVIAPDFWINFLHKRTLGRTVLKATSSDAMVRAYAYAGAAPSPFAAAECAGQGFSLVAINLRNASAAAALDGAAAGASFAAWSLTPGAGGVFGGAAALNGAPLAAGIDVSRADPAAFLERIVAPAVRGAAAAGLALPPTSITFACVSA